MYVIIAKDVLAGIRHRLSNHLPEVKKSHMAEALAAGLGFQSNIALVTMAGEMDSAFHMPFRELDAAGFGARLQQFGYDIPLNMTDLVAKALSVAPSRAFIERYEAGNVLERLDGRWSKLLPHDVCYMAQASFAFVTDNRPDPERFILEGSTAGVGQLDGRLLTIWSEMRDLDRTISDFLTDLVLSGRVNLDQGEGRKSTWATPVFPLFRRRVIRFVNGVMVTWNNDRYPEVSPVRSLKPRVKRPIALTMSNVIDGREFGLRAAEVVSNGEETVRGLLSMGLWLSGAEIDGIEAEALDILKSADGTDFATAIVSRFPGTGMDVIRHLEGLMFAPLPPLAQSSYISASGLEVAKDICRGLRSAGQTLGKMPAPTSKYAATNDDLALLKTNYKRAVAKSDPDWLMIDFKGVESNHHLLAKLLDWACPAGIGILAVRPPLSVDRALEHSLREKLEGDGTEEDGATYANPIVYRV